MATRSTVETKAKTGSPAGTVTTPPAAPSVSPGTQSAARATRRAVAATTPPSQIVFPGNLLSQRQYVRQQLEARKPLEQAQTAAETALGTAERTFGEIAPYTPPEFTQPRPVFNNQAVSRAMPLLMVMTTLGGKRSRINALAMMKAMDSGLKGLRDGNERAYKQALTDYEANYKEFQRREEVSRKQYDLLREMKKDGVALATAKYERAKSAVDDFNKETASNLQFAATFEKNARDIEKHYADLALTEAQTIAALAKPGQKKENLTAEQKNKARAATNLLNDVNTALDVMEKRPQDFSTPINAAFTWSPKVTELAGAIEGGPLGKQSAQIRSAIPSQQAWRRALNTQVVQNAGLSQTVAEMNSQLAAFGSQTLEARKSGMARVRLSLLMGLKDTAEQSDEYKEFLEGKLGMSVDQAIDQARRDVERIESEIRRETPAAAPTAPRGRKSFATVAQAEAAQKSGQIRPGEIILIGGVEYEVTE